MSYNDLFKDSIHTVIKEKPYLRDFFSALAVTIPSTRISLDDFVSSIDDQVLDRLSLTVDELKQQCIDFIGSMEAFTISTKKERVSEVVIAPGTDKNGNVEQHPLRLLPGEIVAVVGPTGSGKSRLLADIECLAQQDTPSGRSVLINGKSPDEKRRLAGEHQLVAQLSQNMNFVMDLSVREFLDMHARSRMIEDIEERCNTVFTMAVDLAGEPFSWETPITSLSGGQSRALMIADVACLSSSPIVLIDEIENAGVDRKKALDLLIEKDKIVLLATHDPLLALSAHRRVIIKNGAISKIIETTEEEKLSLLHLLQLDETLSQLRENVRSGQTVKFTI